MICAVCGKGLPENRRAMYAAGKWCHGTCFQKLDVPIGTRAQKRYPVEPPCYLAMGCLCAGHARGAKSTEPCNTSE